MAAEVAYLQEDIKRALEAARYMAESGVALFLARQATDEEGVWDPKGGHQGTGYWLPKAWHQSKADSSVVDRWRQGMALCAVMGSTVDGLDVDPLAGGDMAYSKMRRAGLLPKFYGRQRTPSGGWHDLMSCLGVHSVNGAFPGIDIKAGVDGEGCGFLFLAPTVKMSKSGELGMYAWETYPELDDLVLVGVDNSGSALREVLLRSTKEKYEGPSYVGRGFADLNDAERMWSNRHRDGLVEYWKVRLAAAVDWPEGYRDEAGCGWELLLTRFAWALARLAVTPWVDLEGADEAHKIYDEVVPSDLALVCGSKWLDGLVEKAAMEPVEPPRWEGFDVVRDRESVDVTNPALAFDWVVREIGMEGTPLAGLFRRGGYLVHTPSINEDGYVALTESEHDEDGPAQVREARVDLVQARIQQHYLVTKRVRGAEQRCMFPYESVRVAMGDLYLMQNLRVLKGVTHTPMLRWDGTVLDRVGYDETSRRLYLPEPGLLVGAVPDKPRKGDVERAAALLLEMLVDFPWNSEHDRANYLCALLTPLMRELVGPPYKLLVINAHQRGSGKSLLAWILRTVHGGVLRGDVPKDGEEFRKQITAVLMSTTAPVVQFDNVRHLEATQMDALLTTDVWSDRILGRSEDRTARNDRLWVATGNNVSLGGDLVRRVLWTSIDPQVPDPEKRTDFQIGDLKGWVRARRGEVLVALLTLVRAWVVAGKPTGKKVGADDYARWIEATRGVLDLAGISGVVGHESTMRQVESTADDEWAAWLSALHEVFGEERWSAADVVARSDFFDVAPEGLNAGSSKAIGKWLSHREGQWAGGLCVRSAGMVDGTKKWRIRNYS